jgi:hypothetical protein
MSRRLRATDGGGNAARTLVIRSSSSVIPVVCLGSVKGSTGPRQDLGGSEDIIAGEWTCAKALLQSKRFSNHMPIIIEWNENSRCILSRIFQKDGDTAWMAVKDRGYIVHIPIDDHPAALSSVVPPDFLVGD